MSFEENTSKSQVIGQQDNSKKIMKISYKKLYINEKKE